MSMNTPLDATALDQLFREARTFSTWQDKPVTDALLEQAWSLAVMGPTGANCLPLRVRFLRSQAEKDKLAPCLMPTNVPKVMAAPVTALLAADQEFYEELPRLYPHVNAKAWYDSNPELAATTAALNAHLQAGYLLLALRAVGLDCGPMSGFDSAAADKAFFAFDPYKSFMLINIGYGEPSALHPRGPRLSFGEACEIR